MSHSSHTLPSRLLPLLHPAPDVMDSQPFLRCTLLPKTMRLRSGQSPFPTLHLHPPPTQMTSPAPPPKPSALITDKTPALGSQSFVISPLSQNMPAIACGCGLPSVWEALWCRGILWVTVAQHLQCVHNRVSALECTA